MLDSGSSNYYTASGTCFVTYRKISTVSIATARQIIYAEGIGDIILNLPCGTIRISDIMHVPAMIALISHISISQLEAK